MKDILISLGLLILPTVGVFYAWRCRPRQFNGWREHCGLIALVALTANLAYSAVFLLWPYFGAKVGSGIARWELTARLALFGFCLSVVSLGLAMFARKQRLALASLSLVAIAFWFTIQIPIADFHAVEGARQAASDAPVPDR